MKKLYTSIGLVAIILGALVPTPIDGRDMAECENQLCFYGVRDCIDAKPSENLQCDGSDDNCTGESSCTG